MTRMTRINKNESEARAADDTRLSSVKSVESAVLIPVFGLNS